MHKLAQFPRSPLRVFSRSMLLELRSIFSDVYAQAHTTCYESHKAPSARDLLPHKRKALIDDRLKEFADRSGIQAKYAKNSIKNCSHIELYTSDACFVTCYVASRSERPRTKFRDLLAQSNYLVFPGLENVPAPFNREFIEILHGPSGRSLDELGFIQFVKPTADMTGDIWAKDIDKLLTTNIVAREEIVDNAPVRLRRNARAIKED